jgi:hypothetical protein
MFMPATLLSDGAIADLRALSTQGSLEWHDSGFSKVIDA